jgi:hypothetical protein
MCMRFWLWLEVMVFNVTFNNISFISWRSVLLVEENGVPAENHRLVASHWQTVSHNGVSSIPRLSGIRTRHFSGDMHWLPNSKYFNKQNSLILYTVKQLRNYFKIISKSIFRESWTHNIYRNTPCFSEVCVALYLVLCVVFCRSLFVFFALFRLAIFDLRTLITPVVTSNYYVQIQRSRIYILLCCKSVPNYRY